MAHIQWNRLEIPHGSVLGINYSGAHDSAVALVSPQGEVLFATSLERITRVKQDGRPPTLLLEGFPWDKVSYVAATTDENLWNPENTQSRLHPVPLKETHPFRLVHGPQFKAFFDRLPKPTKYICHQLSHAHSTFWPSQFEDAICLTYDGGMNNSPWFGGLYHASRKEGLKALDQFHAAHYAKITSLYSIVTGLLGFTPNKHEGKLTGLAAYGRVNPACQAELERLFTEDYFKLERCLEWISLYSAEKSPILMVNESQRKQLLGRFQGISKEDMAATVQKMAEDHILQILKKAKELGLLTSENICLAGGLFANVKINQRVKEFGFKKIFIAPPMTDDGTAWGGALAVLHQEAQFKPQPLKNVFLGHRFESSEIKEVLNRFSIQYKTTQAPAQSLAKLLASGAVVGVFQGAMEFGPRALGNRSILGQATRNEINQSLNDRLCRTEFMPFAPMTRFEDRNECYIAIEGAEHAAEFMTITSDCTDKMKKESPAVVHVDGTARPQLITSQNHPFIHAVLTEYKKLTGLSSIINTSFNIHEEPIVCSPEDALEGFLESGLDYLVFPDLGSEGGIEVAFRNNYKAAVEFLQKKRAQPSQKVTTLKEINDTLWMELDQLKTENREKEKERKLLMQACEERLEVINRLGKEVTEWRTLQGSDRPIMGWKTQIKRLLKGRDA